MLAEIFNLKGKIVEEEVEIVDGFEIWSMQRYDAGKEVGEKKGLDKGIVIGKKEDFNEGIVKGKEDERKQNLENIVKNLMDQSKRDGKILTKAEALKQAEALIS